MTHVALQIEEMTQKGFEEERERAKATFFHLVHTGADKREAIFFKRAFHSEPVVRFVTPIKVENGI